MNELVLDTTCFEKIKKDLNNESKNTRRNALDQLHKLLISSAFVTEFVDKTDIFKTVVKAFMDKTETCRERAVTLAIRCINEWDLSEDHIIFYLLPTIHKHLVTGAETEPAEEVRLCLIKLVKIIIHKYEGKLGPHLKDLVDVLIQCICDEYPEIKREGCECASDLAERVPEFRLHSEDIIKVVLNVLKHKHSKIRVTAINSLKNIVLHGHTGAIELVYSALGQCLLDQNPQIRLSVLRVVAIWFLKLPDRYSFFRYLLPLLLTELTDEIQKNREEAEKLWNEIGLQYLRENEELLKEKEEFLPKQLENYPNNVKRPNLGCRTIVQNEMMKIIPPLLYELEDWKSDVRIKSSELLKGIILHGETRIISFLEIAIPIMCKICSGNEFEVRKNLIEAAEIMGYFVTSDMYWPLIIPRFKENYSTGLYIVLAALLKHNSKNELCQRIKEIVTDLTSSEVCETREERSQNCLLEITLKLLDCLDGSNLEDDITYELYLILVSVKAFGNKETKIKTTELMQKLTKTSSTSVCDLNAKFLPRIFSRFVTSSVIWESYSTDFNIFLALLSEYADDVFKYVETELLEILEIILVQKNDREVIFKTLHTIGKLFEHEDIVSKNNISVIERIILGPLKTQLIWKAGQVLEVVRCTALSIVLLYVRISTAFAPDFISTIYPLVLSLCEDSYVDTRNYSLKILPFVGKNKTGVMESEIFVKSFAVTTGRLNDRNNVVRLNAAITANELLVRAPAMAIYENDSRVEVLKGLKMIFLNADDEDRRIQEAIMDIMKNPSITDNIKSIFSENDIQILIKKYRNFDVSESFKKCLNI